MATAKAPKRRTETKVTKQPDVETIQFPEGVKNKIIALLQQAQALQNQLIVTIDIFMDSKEIEDKDTWNFDQRNVCLYREATKK